MRYGPADKVQRRPCLVRVTQRPVTPTAHVKNPSGRGFKLWNGTIYEDEWLDRFRPHLPLQRVHGTQDSGRGRRRGCRRSSPSSLHTALPVMFFLPAHMPSPSSIPAMPPPSSFSSMPSVSWLQRQLGLLRYPALPPIHLTNISSIPNSLS